MSDGDATLKFRFEVAGVVRLVHLLRIPGVFITKSNDRCLGAEALCIVQTCRITQTPSLADHPDMQRHIYNGHKRIHCLKFQGVTAPNGLCIHFWGAIEGSRHDTTLLKESRLVAFLNNREAAFCWCTYLWRPGLRYFTVDHVGLQGQVHQRPTTHPFDTPGWSHSGGQARRWTAAVCGARRKG
ncbi:hypothetical protein H257_11088 [Aphanomyces astaci]|uniref:DDE Tnp4 domain-containing protein n=1 Tax=Aphanomyces astaci TaxID=112090 RepID=W4G5C8_APHAT|nr:hypothetical protein H257_11088 [Aphanomyces astaci]ETV74123.1 hypothetical protein H257_11088 [Aphanomyces astaci]|eukprot:XP_009836229.1 hypothetical protein H257_11088 [Aphanomyces astaci]